VLSGKTWELCFQTTTITIDKRNVQVLPSLSQAGSSP
jgi:hypothetical protein